MPPAGILFWKGCADNARGAHLECSRRPPVIARVGLPCAVPAHIDFRQESVRGTALGGEADKPIAGLDEICAMLRLRSSPPVTTNSPSDAVPTTPCGSRRCTCRLPPHTCGLPEMTRECASALELSGPACSDSHRYDTMG
jgi:hypothetical protein